MSKPTNTAFNIKDFKPSVDEYMNKFMPWVIERGYDIKVKNNKIPLEDIIKEYMEEKCK